MADRGRVVPFFQRLSPVTQSYVKRAVGIGMSIYFTKAVLTSRQFREMLALVGTWGRVMRGDHIGHGDGLPNDENTILSPIMDMPPEFRQGIWETISPSDLKALRLVCKEFQMDIDRMVGVHVTVDSREEERFEWIKHVAVQRCIVDYLEDVKDWDFLIKPQRLKSLDTGMQCYISQEMLGDLIHHFPNLEELTLYIKEEKFSNTSRNYEIFRAVDDKKEELDFLAVRYIPPTRQFRWTMKFRKTPKIQTLSQLLQKSKNGPVFLPSTIKVILLNFDHYSGFDGRLYCQNRYFWKTLLDSQCNLKVLTSNFGPVCWDIHAQTIERNRLTLERIELHNVSCWESWTHITETEVRFDWNLFSFCDKLEHLSLHAERGPQLGPISYKPLEVCTMHLHSLHCNFGLVSWRFYWSVILANVNTLNSVCLLGLTSCAGESGETDPFNWRMFESCQQLKSLMISGQHLTYMKTINFDRVPAHLEHLGIFWTSLNRQDVLHIGLNMNSLESNLEFLDMCRIAGLENGETGRSLVEACRRGEYPRRFGLRNIGTKFEVNPQLAIGILGALWLFFA